jgi:hypothetical protein
MSEEQAAIRPPAVQAQHTGRIIATISCYSDAYAPHEHPARKAMPASTV